jgi:hypothetical protein
MINKKRLTPEAKAKELSDRYGVIVADEIVDGLLTEIQELSWNQGKIDYYLDVKNGIRLISEYRAQKQE